MKKILFTLLLFLTLSLNISALEVELDRCIDGDTARFITSKGSESTRFLALDTPETVHPTKPEELFGKEASDFTCNKLIGAETIILEFDDNSDMYDRYDRLLAWIFVDGELLQELIIKEGLGEVAYLYGDYKYTDILLEAEDYAKDNQLNIWGDYEEEVYEFDISYLIVLYVLIVFTNMIFFKVKQSNKTTINSIYRRKRYRNTYLLLYILSVIFVLTDFVIILDSLLELEKKYKKLFKKVM